jgi:hypothetical protein
MAAMAATAVSWGGDESVRPLKEVAGEVKAGMAQQGIASLDATVVGIDTTNRNLTVKGPKGNQMTMKIGPYAKGVDQIKVGDTLRVEYREPVITAIRHEDRPQKDGSISTLSTEPLKPAGKQDVWTTQTVTIENVDPATRMLTFRSQDGLSSTLNVAKEFKWLGEFKPGERVTIRSEDAFALTLVPRALSE